MPENKTLTFPPKSEWPTLTHADWASNRRHAFLKFKRLLLSMFTALDFVVGNDNYGGEWALIYDTAARKAHKTYPPPTSAQQQAPALRTVGSSSRYLYQRRLGKSPKLKLSMLILRSPSLARSMPWCTKPDRSAQITSACSSRRNLKATFSSR
jgi:hypothetical protein